MAVIFVPFIKESDKVCSNYATYNAITNVKISNSQNVTSISPSFLSKGIYKINWISLSRRDSKPPTILSSRNKMLDNRLHYYST